MFMELFYELGLQTGEAVTDIAKCLILSLALPGQQVLPMVTHAYDY